MTAIASSDGHVLRVRDFGLFLSGRAFANPASQSFVPFLVSRAQVTRAIAWSASAYQTAAILGPALGGLIYIFGPAAVYAICLALFTIVVASMAGIRTRIQPGAADAG